MSLIAAFAALILSSQEPPPESSGEDVTTVEEVVVQAPGREALRDLVSSLSATNGPQGQLAVFDRRVCPAVFNFRPPFGQMIADRIGGLAQLLGLRVGEPGCSPNVLILALRDADNQVVRMIDEMPNAFTRHSREVSGGMSRLEQFRTSDAVVRWWHVTEVVDMGGPGSRLLSGAETHLIGSIIVVDLDQLPETDINALGDYVAMTALARLEPEMEIAGVDTVLALFGTEDAARPSGLTQFDLDYLDALYNAPRNLRSGNRQESHVVWRMMRDRTQRNE